MAENFKIRAKIERDIFFHGSKKDVYQRLQASYLLEDYKHPLISRMYLRRLVLKEIECPRPVDSLPSDELLPLSRKELFLVLFRTGVDLGLELNALPSKVWLVAALRRIDPDNIFCIIANDYFDFFRLWELNQITIDSVGEGIIFLHEQCAIASIQDSTNRKELYKALIKNKLNTILNYLTDAYPFLMASPLLNNLL